MSDHDQTDTGTPLPGSDYTSCRLLTVHDSAQALRAAWRLARLALELLPEL